MSLTSSQMDRMLEEHFSYEARDDIEGVVATLTEDAVHDIVGFPTGPTRGRDAARHFYRQMFGDLAESKVTPLNRLYGDNFVVDEAHWEGRAPGSPFGFDGQNRPLSFRLLHVVEFSPEGLIKREQVWVDMAAIAQQLGPKA